MKIPLASGLDPKENFPVPFDYFVSVCSFPQHWQALLRINFSFCWDCGIVMVQENASEIFSINFRGYPWGKCYVFRSSTEKRKCQDSQWSFSHGAVAKFVGNAFLMAGNADIYKGNSKAAENVCFLNPAELREFTLMEWSQGNLSVFITFPLMEEAKQQSHHLGQSEFTSKLLPSDLPDRCPLSLILVSHWLRICHISQGDQEIHLASARSLLPFLFLLVFHRTRCAFSGEVDFRLAVAPDDRNGKATLQLSYCCSQGHWQRWKTRLCLVV